MPISWNEIKDPALSFSKKEQIPLLAQILKADIEELQTLWLAEQLYNMVPGEPMADEALKSVSKKIKKAK